jgi:hypothetical protein
MKPNGISGSSLLERADKQQGSRSARRGTYVVGCDAKQDIRVFSGSTYHLAKQGC